ncbi:hypothetical protein L6452_32480 [Arctium lappa]|uniref:Uncharacterized protein n=1 Tax=Arctium lappa TaxID=4217 RepID=A0ACB8Z4R4_ARCLA|nr:hypothetical protein L6452_32480 [Arctium lappa]
MRKIQGQVIQDGWNTSPSGTFMFKVTKRLKALKPLLRRLRASYGRITERVHFLKGVRRDPISAGWGPFKC